MAGRGPAPKDSSKRARRNKDPMMRVVEVEAVPQPPLTDILGNANPVTGEPWQPATLRLWSELAEFPSTELLQSAQWSLLARAMILDDATVSGRTASATEARLQLQKFGIAPDDVARLRIAFAQADEADQKRPPKTPGSKHTYGDLKVVGGDD